MHTMPTPLRLAALGTAALLALAGCSAGDSSSAAVSPGGTVPLVEEGPELPEGASATSGAFALTGFWVKQSSLDASAGFGIITNNATEDDALVAVTSAGYSIEMHQTLDGVMQQVDEFPIAAGGSLVLAPGGNHLMFVGLAQPLQVGQQVPLTLQFQSGATASITAPVEPLSSGDTGH